MKQFFQIFAISCLFLIFNSVESYSQASSTPIQKSKSNVKKVELVVTGMSCQKGCADGIDKKLNKTYGIVKSKTSFEKSKSVVTFDPTVITIPEIIKIIGEKGYEAKLKS